MTSRPESQDFSHFRPRYHNLHPHEGPETRPAHRRADAARLEGASRAELVLTERLPLARHRARGFPVLISLISLLLHKETRRPTQTVRDKQSGIVPGTQQMLKFSVN